MRLQLTMTPAEWKALKQKKTTIWRISDDGPNGSVRDNNIAKFMAKLLHRALENEEGTSAVTS